MQAAAALKNLVTFRSAVPRAVDRGVAEVEDLVQKIVPSSGKQLVAQVYNSAGVSTNWLPRAKKNGNLVR